MNHFCFHYQFPIIKTYNSIQFLDRQGVITLQNLYSEKIDLQFIIPSKEVIRYISLHTNDEEIISTILRTYTGIFEMEISINPTLIAKKSSTTEKAVLAAIDRLQLSQVINLKIHNNDSNITFNEAREDDLTINRISKFLENQNQLKEEKFNKVVAYVEDLTNCKNKLLLTYFNQDTQEDCGICSTCISKNRKSNTTIPLQIIELLKSGALNSKQIQNILSISSEETIFALQQLLEKNKVAINSHNKYYLI